jgi:hypothetical protein
MGETRFVVPLDDRLGDWIETAVTSATANKLDEIIKIVTARIATAGIFALQEEERDE